MITSNPAARWALAALTFVLAPGPLSALALLSGCVLAVAGVHILAGTGWALIAGALPLLAVGAVLLRGVIHG